MKRSMALFLNHAVITVRKIVCIQTDLSFPSSKNNFMQSGSMINVICIKFCFVSVHVFGCYYVAGPGKKLESLCRNPGGKP